MTLTPKTLRIDQSGDFFEFLLGGDWVLKLNSGNIDDQCRNFFSSTDLSGKICKFYFPGSQKWDSSLVVFLLGIESKLISIGGEADFSELPDKVQNLISLAKQRNKHKAPQQPTAQGNSQDWFFDLRSTVIQGASFWGKWLFALGRLLTGRSLMRLGDLLVICRDCVASALPIVTLIAFLTGLTMAFVGSVQLEKFNATIYVADLVSLAMVREMGALMVAIVMAGRDGGPLSGVLV